MHLGGRGELHSVCALPVLVDTKGRMISCESVPMMRGNRLFREEDPSVASVYAHWFFRNEYIYNVGYIVE